MDEGLLAVNIARLESKVDSITQRLDRLNGTSTNHAQRLAALEVQRARDEERMMAAAKSSESASHASRVASEDTRAANEKYYRRLAIWVAVGGVLVSAVNVALHGVLR